MSIANPFADNAPTDLEDRAFVARARSGDREALEDLVQRHQGWIYNIAIRMLYHPQDAEDATQEILIKADPENLLFAHDHIRQVREVVPQVYEAIRTLDDQCADIYRQHPFYESPDLVPMLRRLFESPDFRRATDLP